MVSMKKKYLATMTACFVFFVYFFMFQSNLSVISNLDESHSTRTQDKEDFESKSTSNPVRDQFPPRFFQSPRRKISCDRSHRNYDLCAINGPTVLDPTISTFFLEDSSTLTPPSVVEKIRPYPRKWESFTVKRIKELTITSGPQSPKCDVQHDVPALAISAGGYTGNVWHDFNDGFIPLFITVNTIFPDDQDFVLVVSEARDWWIRKYADLLQAFSKHPIINLGNDTAVHCFTSATLGFISHGFMTIEPALMPNSKTFVHFRTFLEKAYGHVRNTPSRRNSAADRPQLVLASRRGNLGRVILNQAEVIQVAKEIGFDVNVFEPTPKTPLHQAYALINSSHAMIGVHGAALTHSLFLRPGSVLVQVVPLGIDWLAVACFGKSAKAMGLEYMEYDIDAEESSLVEKYDKNELLIKDPVASRGKNWSEAIMTIYLKEQNVDLDLVRFREYMNQVYKKAKQFMEKEG